VACRVSRASVCSLFPYTTLFRSVVVRTGRGADVPAQTDQDRGQARRFLAQRDIAALGQGDSHGVTPSRRAWSRRGARPRALESRSEEHTSELQSRENLVSRLLLE